MKICLLSIFFTAPTWSREVAASVLLSARSSCHVSSSWSAYAASRLWQQTAEGCQYVLSIRQKLERRQSSRSLSGPTNAKQRLFVGHGRSTFWRNENVLQSAQVCRSGSEQNAITTDSRPFVQPDTCWWPIELRPDCVLFGLRPAKLSRLPFISEASSRDPFAFSTLRQPRCMKLMALVCLMVTL